MKCSVHQLKERKIMMLEKENYMLNQQLDALLTEHEQSIESQKHIVNSYNSLVNKQTLEEMRQQMLIKSLKKLKYQQQQQKITSESLSQKLSKLKEQNTQKQQQLQEWYLQCEQKSRIVAQMKDEWQLGKSLGALGRNTVKTCEILKEKHQNMLRNLQILKDKLASKNRYLEVLKKKEKKQSQPEEPKKTPHISSFPKASQDKKHFKQANQPEEMAKIIKPNMKNFNASIRKKNQILLGRK